MIMRCNLNTILMIIVFGIQVPCAFGRTKPAKAPLSATAEWTMLVYIVADNSLASFASYNINDMSAGLASTKGTNIIVQWDKPGDNKTWRYKITPGGKVDAGTLSNEMGFNPVNELTASMSWVKQNYPAKKYALILWDHGSGVEDFAPGVARSMPSAMLQYCPWMQLPGYAPVQGRGILYDDSQGTCLTNQGMKTALANIKKALGKNLDILATDACLMAMAEVAYQVKDSVNILIGSEQTIPGTGYPYSKFIRPLSLNPAAVSPSNLAQSIISSYAQYYTKQDRTPDFTLSAINVQSIGDIKDNVIQFMNAVDACSQIDANATKEIILAARQAALSFEMPEYIDLYSFYAAILNRTKKFSPKSHAILAQRQKDKVVLTRGLQDALNALSIVIQDGLSKITSTVLYNATGPVYAGAKGISIYYPADGVIHRSYPLTMFAQDTGWASFVQQYHN